MEDPRFDRVTRAFAGGLERRSVLKALAAAFAVAASAGRSTLAAPDGDCPDGCPDGKVCRNGGCRKGCKTDDECANLSDDACMGGSCDDGICRQFAADCQQGYVCCKNGECCPQDCVTDIDCYVNDPCRTGTCSDGKCSFTRRDPCVVCDSDADCDEMSPGATCCGGACIRPCPDGTILSKGCECVVVSTGGMNADGISVSQTDSGADNQRPSNNNPPPAANGGDVTIVAPPTESVTTPPSVTTGDPSSAGTDSGS